MKEASAPSAPGSRVYLMLLTVAAALGGLLFGYDTAVISGAVGFLQKHFELGAGLKGWAASSALVGCIVGAMAGGPLSDRFGRKKMLVLCAVLFALSGIGSALPVTLSHFVWARFLGGFAIGAVSVLSPLYIAEIAPASMRGRLVSMNQLTIALGVMAAQIVNWVIAQPTAPGTTIAQIPMDSWNVQVAWRWMFGVTAFPAVVFFIAMFFVPESPRWLAKKGRSARARLVLGKIGGSDYADFSVKDIEATLVNEIDRVDLRELLSPKMLKILFVGVVLAVFQQWCGINVIFQYG